MERRKFLDALGAGSLAVLARPEQAIRKGEMAGHRDPQIEVNLNDILWNYDQVKKRAKAPVMAVVKANAYGHGLVEVAKALEKAGAAALMVGKLRKAGELREAGIRCPILNFGPFGREDGEGIVVQRISQAV